MGEVQYPTSHFFRENLSREDYINLSGGLNSQADEGRIYIVRASGEVIGTQGSRWFLRGEIGDVLPGDTVVVPLDTPLQGLAFWSSVTQIMYNLAIASAAVSSF